MTRQASPVDGGPALDAEWTHDCSGKQDYDADLVQLSTRYWPRGGGFMVLDTRTGAIEGNDARPEIKPSAKAAILLQGVEVAEAEFEGDTEADVKAQVEQWAAAQWRVIYAAVCDAMLAARRATLTGDTEA